MNKTSKVLIIVAGLLAVLLTLGIGVPTLLANDSASQSTPPQSILKEDGIVAQVAAILNISTDNLTRAIKQATQELKGTKMTDDAFYGKVAGILGIEKATLETAVQKATAALLDKKVAAILDQAVAKGTITQAEAAQIETWFSQRPSALEKLFNFNKFHGLMGWGHEKDEKPQTGNHGKPSIKTPKKPAIPAPTATANATSLKYY